MALRFFGRMRAMAARAVAAVAAPHATKRPVGVHHGVSLTLAVSRFARFFLGMRAPYEVWVYIHTGESMDRLWWGSHNAPLRTGT